MPAPHSGRGAHLQALTGLRYVAAMTVVTSHVAQNSEWLDVDLLRGLSTIGMPLFFTLSGFLLCYNYFPDFVSRPREAWRLFAINRLARIYPAYFVALILSFSFMGNFFHDVQDEPRDTAISLACDLTLTQSWVYWPVFTWSHNPRTVSQAYLGIAWSVSTEAFFYATFPVTVWALSRLRTRAALWICAAVVLLGWTTWNLWYFRGAEDFWPLVGTNTFHRWLLNYSPYARISEFWLGCVTGRLFALRTAVHERSRPFFGDLATGCVLAALLVATSQVGEHWLANRLHLNTSWAPLCALLIYGLASWPSSIQRLLTTTLFVRLGEISYSLFLLHPLVQSLFLTRTQGEDDLTDWPVVAYNHAAMLIVLHLLAVGLYVAVERPARARIRDWAARSRGLGVAEGRSPSDLSRARPDGPTVDHLL